jgi:acyl-CoA synthetase (AMP-forming)/AMP-acid ligase II
MTNLANHLLRTAAEHPDRPAVKLDEQVLSYAQLRDAAARMATLLRQLGSSPVTGWACSCRTCRRSRSRVSGHCSPARPWCR